MEYLTKIDFSYRFNIDKCSECDGNCCIGESGYIWISKQEIIDLAKFLDKTINEVGINYLIKIGYKYSIKEIEFKKDNYSCIFFDLEKKRCSIYEFRPKQCRTFPFWDYFKDNKGELYDECPAVEEIK